MVAYNGIGVGAVADFEILICQTASKFILRRKAESRTSSAIALTPGYGLG
jgi:hypothetical protein